MNDCNHGLLAETCPDCCWPAGKHVDILGGFIRLYFPMAHDKAEAELARQRFLDAQGEPVKWIPPYEPVEPDMPDLWWPPLGWALLAGAAVFVLAFILSSGDKPGAQDLPADPVVDVTVTTTLPPAPIATPIPAPDPSSIVITWET